MNKDFDTIDAKGFIIKMRTHTTTKHIPLFLVGDFSPREIQEFKTHNVISFLSDPINPYSLIERLNIFFNLPPLVPKKTTPMLLDIHVKGKIIIIQLEGNLESEKLAELTYLLRMFFHQNQIKEPKIFFIIPHLYPESITKENIDLLFKFIHVPECNIQPYNVKFLTNNKELIDAMKAKEEYSQFEVVKDYVDGIQSLLIDFDKKKQIPAQFIKKGCAYIFDLFDKSGRRLIPALTKVSQYLLEKLKQENIHMLTYYSDTTISAIGDEEAGIMATVHSKNVLDLITSNFEPIGNEIFGINLMEEKKTLFFRNLKGQQVLLITHNKDIKNIIKNCLDIYFKIKKLENGFNIKSILDKENFIVIFLDAEITKPTALELLCQIRSHATRRKTSVIIFATKVNKPDVLNYKRHGTDHIIIAPFTTSKLIDKVYQSLLLDRGH